MKINQKIEHQTAYFPPGSLPLRLDCGKTLNEYRLAYQAYGQLNPQGDNAILVCHALTGDQYAAEINPVTNRPAWFSHMVGPGKPADTNRYYVICSNVLGGCMGSTGPGSINPETNKIWAIDFPTITISDMVRAQANLLAYLGIKRLFAVIGGSMGGMQALEWLHLFSDKVDCAVLLATSYRQSPLGIALNETARQAIMRDPDWRDGNYDPNGPGPANGLSIARMIGMITYQSIFRLEEEFGHNLQKRSDLSYSLDADYTIESYLRHHGDIFPDRFDANSYLYLIRSCNYFNQARNFGSLEELYKELFVSHKPPVCIISFDSDWTFPTKEGRHIEEALRAAGVAVHHHVYPEAQNQGGHDAFLKSDPDMEGRIRQFLSARRRHLGLSL
ncbi:MAG: homoserine O-acetyltransferase [Magnetococcales bacterium]|nr:homoserine O-acetyltransferase [Magnetococcales bacterium]MBF0117188.1 homoserine O-acetyltransferase [Magnetococcales bacterium]